MRKTLSTDKLKQVIINQLTLLETTFAGSEYARLMSRYERLFENGLAHKHHTHDSIVYITDEGKLGFKVVKFYEDRMDYRISGHYQSLGEAHSEALCYL